MFSLIVAVLNRDYNRVVLESLLRTVSIRGKIPQHTEGLKSPMPLN